MPDIASLVASIDSRLDILNAEISRLEQARRALEKSTRNGGSGSSTAAGREPQTNGTATAKPARAEPNRLDPDRAEPDRAEPDRAEPERPEPERPEPNGSSARRTRARARAGSPSRSARRKQAPLHPDDLERALAAGGGLSASAVAEQASADYQATLRALRELEASGRVRREGTRRSTRWRVITDEERIAARAAELERLMRGSS
jgi:hypothetical protein